MIETYLIAIVLPIGVAVGFLLLVRQIDELLDNWRTGDAPDDPYGLGPAAPGSIDDTLSEIRSLPEMPFNWQRDRAL